jgi:hypothetical protein
VVVGATPYGSWDEVGSHSSIADDHCSLGDLLGGSFFGRGILSVEGAEGFLSMIVDVCCWTVA